MFPAKKIMTTDVVTVDEHTPVYAAIRLLVEHNITGLPVIDGEHHLVGIISEKDLLGALYNSRIRESTVGAMMTREVTTFREDSDLIDICEAMIAGNFRRVPIVNKGKLVGLVSRRDIIKFILHLRQED